MLFEYCDLQGQLIQVLKHSRLVSGDATLESMKLSRCGRTDSGVSARAQVGQPICMLHIVAVAFQCLDVVMQSCLSQQNEAKTVCASR